MISYDDGLQIYRTTEKGTKFLGMADEISEMFTKSEDLKIK